MEVIRQQWWSDKQKTDELMLQFVIFPLIFYTAQRVRVQSGPVTSKQFIICMKYLKFSDVALFWELCALPQAYMECQSLKLEEHTSPLFNVHLLKRQGRKSMSNT